MKNLLFWLNEYRLDIRDFFMHTWVEDLYHWFLYRFNRNHQYHLIRIGKPGYYDQCERIRDGVFKCFTEYYEKEYLDWRKRGGDFGFKIDGEDFTWLHLQIGVCYKWITKHRAEAYNSADNEPDITKACELERNASNVDTEILKQIIEMRDYLWT